MPVQDKSLAQIPITSTSNIAHGMLAPKLSELGILITTTAIGFVALLLEGRWMLIMNIAIPAVIMVSMLRGTIDMLKVSVATVWTPLLWFRAATFFYGGFGTLIAITAGDAERNYLETFFSFFAGDILKYNVVVILFTCVILLVVKIVLARPVFGAKNNDLLKLSQSSVGAGIVGFALLTVGTVANFVFIVPFQFGYVNTTFPAIISEIAQAALVGLFLTLVALGKTRSPLIFPLILLGLIFSAIGLLAFSKASVVMPIVMLGLAFFYLKPTIYRIVIVGLVTVTTFYLAAPLVDQGRMLMSVRYGGLDAPAPPEERFEMLNSYFDANTSRPGDEEVDYASLRFSYVNVGTFVIALRDRGQSGVTYGDAAAVFIPRAVWPDKPIITDVARELSFDATGNWNSSIAPGLAPEAYWNGGWLGVVLMSGAVGVIIAFWSIYNLSAQLAGAWHLFPIMLLGVRMGSRLDGFFVVDVLGPLAFAIIGHLIISLINTAIRQRQLSAPRQSAET